MRENRPVLLRSSPFTGPITKARGPWRISGNWWDNQTWARDEWDIQTRDGVAYRLALQNQDWFVEGIYD
jgi:protein ImuB